MRALVTGSHGFVGKHLRKQLRESGWEVAGLGTSQREPDVGETYSRVDLALGTGLAEALEAADPDAVFHLAARTGRVTEAHETVEAAVSGTLQLCSALVRRGRPVRVVVAGSSAQYGVVPPRCDPVDESAPQHPLGVYGWSKVAAEAIALAHHGRNGVEVLAARAFNHTGPSEPPHLVCSSFARGVARVEAGEKGDLEVGDLETVRDFTDVRDVARAYLELAERGTSGRVYNVCSGRATRVRDVLEVLLDRSEVTVEVRTDPRKARSPGLPRQVGSNSRIRREVGWEPRIDLQRSLDDLLGEWRRRLDVISPRGSQS